MSTLPFHPAVSQWFADHHGRPTPPQERGFPHIRAGAHVLIAAPTGSGKTLSAFLSAINDLLEAGLHDRLPDETFVVYVSPLKALSRDIERNLQVPLAGIKRQLQKQGTTAPEIRTALRTGDTSASERSRILKQHPHILVTTPESLYLLLTSERGQKLLGKTRTIIVDEIHALLTTKRGAHLALSLERLTALCESNGLPQPQRVGLSATQNPPQEVAKYLTGGSKQDPLDCIIIDEGHQRTLDLSAWVPEAPLEAVMSAEAWTGIYDELARLIDEHRTTLIFANTRKLTERVTRFLAERIGKDLVTSHHGSLSRQLREDAESRLKAGKLRALVATASLELGIDIGDVDLVCQLGSPGSVATLLQRVGRSGHSVGAIPKGRLFPQSRDDLVQCAALLDCVQRGELDRVEMCTGALDILSQQLVATLAAKDWNEEELYTLVTKSAPYAALSKDQFDAVVGTLTNGFVTSRGRRAAYVHRDETTGRLRARRGARLAALTSGGAIPENFDYDVLLMPSEVRVGSVNEDFAIESSAGDVFQLGNTSYQIEKVDPGAVRVHDAQGLPPNLPFWLGEAPSRSDELSASVSRLRTRVEETLQEDETFVRRKLASSLATELGLSPGASEQLVDYLSSTFHALGTMPTQRRLVAERFFDETGAMHIVIHCPRGMRVNRALGLALRKRFCRSFNVELQAAAGEDALLLSLGPMHSFPLHEVWSFLSPDSAEHVLTQALLDSPLFQTRFRHNATRALAILRYRGGKRTPPRFQRMEADDLLAQCFPDQVACLENIAGDRSIPEHPLVEQTIADTLNEAMDVDRFVSLLTDIKNGTVETISLDLTEPSPLAHEILNARPYAFLDDAPLEERRAQAVVLRRNSLAAEGKDLAQLDPEAIAQVLSEAEPDPRDPDELHDVLTIYAFATFDETLKWEQQIDRPLIEPLLSKRRATVIQVRGSPLLVASSWSERALRAVTRNEITDLAELCRGRLEWSGPITASEMAALLGIDQEAARSALLTLETEGFAVRGRFKTSTISPSDEDEFCERRLLARIHRRTLGRLRREIEPVSPSQLIEFYCHWQGLATDKQYRGPEGTLAVIERLAGFPIAAGAWEADVLPSRVANYDPSFLDQLSLSGQILWKAANLASRRLTRATPILLLPRQDAGVPASFTSVNWNEDNLSSNARRVAQYLVDARAAFFPDIQRSCGLLTTQAEEAISELTARGYCTTDGFSGLRTLITPASRRRKPRRIGRPSWGRRTRHSTPLGLEWAGRISWCSNDDSSFQPSELSSPQRDQEELTRIAWRLLRRWGIVFHRLLVHEDSLPPWRELVRVFWRLEARGEIRGGRFVSLFSGEQFALPEAVADLRRLRRGPPTNQPLRICASDPLNLAGILTPDPRVSRSSASHLEIVGGQYRTRKAPTLDTRSESLSSAD